MINHKDAEATFPLIDIFPTCVMHLECSGKDAPLFGETSVLEGRSEKILNVIVKCFKISQDLFRVAHIVSKPARIDVSEPVHQSILPYCTKIRGDAPDKCHIESLPMPISQM